jgi:hypothetical protein
LSILDDVLRSKVERGERRSLAGNLAGSELQAGERNMTNSIGMAKSIVVLLVGMQISTAAIAQQYTWRQIWPPADRYTRQKAAKANVESDYDRRIRLVRERDAKEAADKARRQKERFDAERNPPEPPPIKLWDNTNQTLINTGLESANPFGLR